MSVLWLAFGIYILGVATVLFIRPNIMFRPGSGTWKEFGLSNHNSYTILPFWLFTLIWAVVSYVFATVGTIVLSGLTLQSLNINMNGTTNNGNDFLIPISSVKNMPTSAATTNMSTELPGYYILESVPGSPPKYVYFGTSPPKISH